MLSLILVRHTTPDIERGVCYGKTDLEVAKSFPKDAKLVKQKLTKQLNKQSIEQIISSPALRCQKLAKYLSEEFKQPRVRLEPTITELDFGAWEQKTWQEIETKDSENFGNWCHNFNVVAPPEGESYQALTERVELFLEKLFDEYKLAVVGEENKLLVIVTHSSVVRAVVKHTLNLDMFDSMSLDVDFGSLTKVYFDRKLKRLAFLNK